MKKLYYVREARRIYKEDNAPLRPNDFIEEIDVIDETSSTLTIEHNNKCKKIKKDIVPLIYKETYIEALRVVQYRFEIEICAAKTLIYKAMDDIAVFGKVVEEAQKKLEELENGKRTAD